MRFRGVVVLGVLLVSACGDDHQDPVQDPVPDPPPVEPCGVLGLSGPPATQVALAGWVPTAADINGDGKLDLVGVTRNAVSAALGNGNGTFQPVIQSAIVSTALYTRSTVVVDVNGDGKPDIVQDDQVDAGGDVLAIRLGDGAGHFQTGASYPAVPAFEFAAKDLNGDGHVDLVVVGGSTSTVRLGVGDGTFGSETTLPIDYENFVAIGDVSGDGVPDLVFASHYDSVVRVMVGSGNGTFAAPYDRPTLYAPSAIAVADLNGDGKADVVTASLKVSVLMNDGTGSLLDHVDYAFGTSAIGMKVVDTDGNGVLDIVISESELKVLRVNGDGTLQPAATLAPMSFSRFALGDLDGDHAADVLLETSESPGIVTVLKKASVPTLYAMGSSSTNVVAANFDGDAHVDLALTSASSVDLALGANDAMFAAISHLPVNGPVGAVRKTDLNGDGVLDMVVRSAGGMSALIGHGDGTFADAVESPLPASSPFAVGDVNADGRADLVTTTTFGHVAVSSGNGDGTFGGAADIGVLNGRATAVQLGDINGDGVVDVVVARQPGCIECQNQGTYGLDVLLGGSGTIALPVPTSPTFAVQIADLDLDGDLDIVTNSNTGLMVLRNNGDGTVQMAGTYKYGSTFDLVDITGDGKLDIVSGVEGLSILRGNGDATFQDPMNYLGDYDARRTFGDVDGDGRLDVITPGSTFSVRFQRCVQ